MRVVALLLAASLSVAGAIDYTQHVPEELEALARIGVARPQFKTPIEAPEAKPLDEPQDAKTSIVDAVEAVVAESINNIKEAVLPELANEEGAVPEPPPETPPADVTREGDPAPTADTAETETPPDPVEDEAPPTEQPEEDEAVPEEQVVEEEVPPQLSEKEKALVQKYNGAVDQLLKVLANQLAAIDQFPVTVDTEVLAALEKEAIKEEPVEVAPVKKEITLQKIKAKKDKSTKRSRNKSRRNNKKNRKNKKNKGKKGKKGKSSTRRGALQQAVLQGRRRPRVLEGEDAEEDPEAVQVEATDEDEDLEDNREDRMLEEGEDEEEVPETSELKVVGKKASADKRSGNKEKKEAKKEKKAAKKEARKEKKAAKKDAKLKAKNQARKEAKKEKKAEKREKQRAKKLAQKNAKKEETEVTEEEPAQAEEEEEKLGRAAGKNKKKKNNKKKNRKNNKKGKKDLENEEETEAAVEEPAQVEEKEKSGRDNGKNRNKNKKGKNNKNKKKKKNASKGRVAVDGATYSAPNAEEIAASNAHLSGFSNIVREGDIIVEPSGKRNNLKTKFVVGPLALQLKDEANALSKASVTVSLAAHAHLQSKVTRNRDKLRIINLEMENPAEDAVVVSRSDLVLDEGDVQAAKQQLLQALDVIRIGGLIKASIENILDTSPLVAGLEDHPFLRS